MCYKCEVPGCGVVVPAGLDQKKFTHYRQVKRKELAGYNSGSGPDWRDAVRTEVAGELRVCHGCWASLQLMSLTQLVRFKEAGKDRTAHMQPQAPPVTTAAGVKAGKPLELKAASAGELVGQRRKKNRRKEGNGQSKPHRARG